MLIQVISSVVISANIQNIFNMYAKQHVQLLSRYICSPKGQKCGRYRNVGRISIYTGEKGKNTKIDTSEISLLY